NILKALRRDCSSFKNSHPSPRSGLNGRETAPIPVSHGLRTLITTTGLLLKYPHAHPGPPQMVSVLDGDDVGDGHCDSPGHRRMAASGSAGEACKLARGRSDSIFDFCTNRGPQRLSQKPDQRTAQRTA